MSKKPDLMLTLLALILLIVPHILVASISSTSYFFEGSDGYNFKVNNIGYDTVQSPVYIKTDTPENVKSLTLILSAVSEYENDHYSFPLSEKNGQNWSSPANSNKRWIAGLTPDYIEIIPEDKNRSNKSNYNFLYKSDGTNFKLIAHRPGDCEEVKRQHPELVDQKRDCYAYGYWTREAEAW